ncbi:MAG: NUDIX domain-containing protein [Rhodospirillales bacterium]|nr:NUDIX domain-containing protein [Rhodospirillales bacterium]
MAFPPGCAAGGSSLPDAAPLPHPETVPARDAASLVVLRQGAAGPEMLMGMRGAGHRFMPNRLVFPGGAVDAADRTAPAARPLDPLTRARLEKAANADLAHGLAIAAARELEEETGLSLGSPPDLGGLHYLCRMVTPPGQPIRFNARFLLVEAAAVSGTLAGSGELEGLRFFAMAEALAMPIAEPQRKVLGRVRAWLAMSEAERAAEALVPAYVRHVWVLE